MAHRIAFISQSGNVMKTSLAFGMAVEGVRNGLNVVTCDLDREHRSLAGHQKQRVDMEIEPLFPVIEAENAQEALRNGTGADLYLIDCPSRATAATVDVAKGVDLAVQPTTTSRKDLDLAIKTFYQIVQAGVPVERLLFVITRASTAARLREAQEYLSKAAINGQHFAILSTPIWERAGYEMAINDGFSIVETTYPSLNTASKAAIHEILTRCLRHD